MNSSDITPHLSIFLQSPYQSRISPTYSSLFPSLSLSLYLCLSLISPRTFSSLAVSTSVSFHHSVRLSVHFCTIMHSNIHQMHIHIDFFISFYFIIITVVTIYFDILFSFTPFFLFHLPICFTVIQDFLFFLYQVVVIGNYFVR